MYDFKFSKSDTLYYGSENKLGSFTLVSFTDSSHLSVWASMVWLVMPSRSVAGVPVPFAETKVDKLFKGTKVSENNSDLSLRLMDCSACDNPNKFIL